MSNFNFAELTPLLPEIFLALASMVLLVAGVIRGNQSTNFISWAALCGGRVAILLLVLIPLLRRIVPGVSF